MPHKFSVYEEVEVTKCEVLIEKGQKGMCKYRWTVTGEREGKARDSESREDRRKKLLFNPTARKFDFRQLKATDQRFNKIIYLPGPKWLEENKEVKIQSLNIGLMEIVNDFAAGNGKKREPNLKRTEKEGLKTLKRRRDDKEMVIFHTDKSGRFAVDSVNNHKLAREEHVKEDSTITEEQYRRLQQDMNTHAFMWT